MGEGGRCSKCKDGRLIDLIQIRGYVNCIDVLVFVQNNYLYRFDFPLRMRIEKYTTRDVGIIQPCKKNENESVVGKARGVVVFCIEARRWWS